MGGWRVDARGCTRADKAHRRLPLPAQRKHLRAGLQGVRDQGLRPRDQPLPRRQASRRARGGLPGACGAKRPVCVCASPAVCSGFLSDAAGAAGAKASQGSRCDTTCRCRRLRVRARLRSSPRVQQACQSARPKTRRALSLARADVHPPPYALHGIALSSLAAAALRRA